MFRYLGLLLLAVPVFAEDVAHCFEIREMQKTEPGRYGVHAVSNCARTYDAVYVMVSFFDAKGKHMDDGVWAIYWCRPGRTEIHEFAVPRAAYGFHRMSLRGITIDAEKGLGVRGAGVKTAAYTAANIPPLAPAGASTGPVRVIGDPGER